jgi:hypothetical protein
LAFPWRLESLWLIFEKIYKIDGVQRTETSMILQYIKRRYDWGTAIGTV